MASQSEIWNELEDDIICAAKSVYDKVQTNWEELFGKQSEEMLTRSKDFINKVKAYLLKLEQESETEKSNMIIGIETMLKEITKLSKELHKKEDLDLPNDVPLTELNNRLYNIVSAQRRLKHERQSEYKKLREEEIELCNILRIQLSKAITGIASETEIKNLEEYIQDLHEQKEQMENSIDEHRSKCTDLLKELGISPLLSIEKFCISGNTTMFHYTMDTHKELEKLLEKLLSQRQGAIEEANQLRNKLTILWDRVAVPHDERESVLHQCQGHSKEQIAQLKEEVDRCEELKRANLKVYVTKVKEELKTWWERCCYSEEQMASFRPFHEQRLSEELLDILELELEKMRDFYLRYDTIFHLSDRRRDMWEQFRQLEESSKDSNRLFNRGCLLLKEEKARKKIQKELPKLEQQLRKKLDEFETFEGRPFLLHGKDPRIEMDKNWQMIQNKKDAQKTARKVAKTEQTQPTARTPLMARKRKMTPGSSHTNVSKVKRVASDTSIHTYSISSCGTDKSASSKKIANGRRAFAVTPSNVSASSTYSLFQEHFEDLSKGSVTPCRSTLVPGSTALQSTGYGTRILRPRNGQTVLHSSPKTPFSRPDFRAKSKRNNQNIQSSPVYSSAMKPPRDGVISSRRLGTPAKSQFKVATGSASRIPKVVMPTKSPRLPIIF